MKIIRRWDMVVVTGSYTNRDTGAVKKIYRTIGTLAETETGPVIWLDRAFNPAAVASGKGDGSILVSCYAKDEDTPARYGDDEAF